MQIKTEFRTLMLLMQFYSFPSLIPLHSDLLHILLHCQKVRADNVGEEDFNFVSVLGALTTFQIFRRNM